MNIIKSRAFAAMAALAVTLLVQIPTTLAQGNKWDAHDQQINSPFVTVAAGIYTPVEAGNGPEDNLGLDPGKVNLSDGSYLKVNMYPVSGLAWIPGNKNADKAIGTFYVSLTGGLCAYDLPGGSFSARFDSLDLDKVTAPDGSWTMDGTAKLSILEATGIYQPLANGHIHMADILKLRAGDGTLLEQCFCHIHPKLVAP